MALDEQSRRQERLIRAQDRLDRARKAKDIPGQIESAMECGVAHFELREPADLEHALDLFRDAINLVEQSGQRGELLPELFGMIGRTQQRLKKWDDVVPWYRRAAEAAAARGASVERLRWLGKEASTLFDMKDLATGRARLEETVRIGRELHAAGEPVAEELSDHVQHLALVADRSESGDAAALWHEAKALLDRLPIGRAHYRYAVDFAGYHASHDRHFLAETYLDEAREISQQLEMSEQDRGQLEMKRAALWRARNEAERAGDHLARQLPTFVTPYERHELQTAIVQAYFAAGSWEKMKDACLALQEMRRDMRPGWQHDAAMLLGVACMELKDFDGAVAARQLGMQLARLWGNPEAWLNTRGELVIGLVEQGHYRRAVMLAEDLWAEGDRRSLTVRTFIRALIGWRKLDRAVQIVAEYRAAPVTAGKANTGEDVGKEQTAAYLDALLADAGHGDPLAAWQAYFASARRSAASQAEALAHLIGLYPKGSREQLEAARHRLRLTDRARSRVNDVFSDASWRAAVRNAPEFPGYLDTFLEAAIAGGAHGQAVYELERFRAQSLVNLLAERKAFWAIGEVRHGWFKLHATQDYQRERYRLAGLSALGAPWQQRRAAAERLEELAGRALTAEGLIHFAPENQGMQFPQELNDLLGKEPLAEGELLVIAHPLTRSIALWATGKDRNVVAGALPGINAEDVRRLGRTVRALSGATSDDVDLQALLDELERRIAAPLMAWLQPFAARHVFFTGGTAMFTLPLDCCASTLAAPISLLPTSAALAFTREVRRPLPEGLFLVKQEDRDRWSAQTMAAPRGKMLVVVDPSRDLEMAPLEAAMVTHASGDRTVQFLDETSIASETMARACEQVEVLHVIGHGNFDQGNPYRSGMYLGPRADLASLWTNAEIFSGVNAPAGRLAILSGCETGQTKPNLVSEEVSLPAALIASGYACVIASRWLVDDISTSLFMGHFYEQWSQGGVSVCAALSASQSWLRQVSREEVLQRLRAFEPRLKDVLPGWNEARAQLTGNAIDALARDAERPFADAYFWAPFFVTGDGTITSDGVDCRALPMPPQKI